MLVRVNSERKKGRTSRAVKVSDVENVDGAALSVAVEEIAAGIRACVESGRAGKGSADEGDENSSEGLHF